METTETWLKALMLAGLTGEKEAYRLLLSELTRHFTVFFGRRLQGDASSIEDLVQETLISVHTRRDTYDPAEPFTPWAYAIARYKLIDHYRRLRRRVTVPLEAAGDIFAEDVLDASEARRDVDALLASLPEKTQALMRSVKLEEFSHAEAGASFGMSEGAVKVAVHRAVKLLSRRIARTGDDHDR